MTKQYRLKPSEKVFGVGLIGSVMAIDSVMKSNYGGFKYRGKK